MVQVKEAQWSLQEKEIVETALVTAHQREIDGLVRLVREQAQDIDCIDDVWRLNDFLSARRFDIDGKYANTESEALFVLARLVKEGWLTTDDLNGLASDKLAKITALTRVL